MIVARPYLRRFKEAARGVSSRGAAQQHRQRNCCEESHLGFLRGYCSDVLTNIRDTDNVRGFLPDISDAMTSHASSVPAYLRTECFATMGQYCLEH